MLENALWPDAEGDAAHFGLETTLKRLRRLCDDNEVVARAGGRLSLDERRVWTDVRALKQVAERIDHRLAAAAALSDGALAARLFALYRGDFLADEELAWAIPVRERLRAGFARAVAALAKPLEQAGAWERALDVYERAAAAAPLVESFYQGLIRCQSALGRRADALASLDRCRRLLGGV